MALGFLVLWLGKNGLSRTRDRFWSIANAPRRAVGYPLCECIH